MHKLHNKKDSEEMVVENFVELISRVKALCEQTIEKGSDFGKINIRS